MTPLTSRSGINTTDEEQICGCKELGIWERGECDYKGVTQGSLVLVQPFCVLIVVVAIQVFTCDIIPYTCTHRHTHTHTQVHVQLVKPKYTVDCTVSIFSLCYGTILTMSTSEEPRQRVHISLCICLQFPVATIISKEVLKLHNQ
jgi:hypothetical protein